MMGQGDYAHGEHDWVMMAQIMDDMRVDGMETSWMMLSKKE
jgi:hypothetical protein